MIPVRAYARLLVDYLRPQRARVTILAALLVTVIALQLVNPQFIREFLDRATAGGTARDLVPLALWFMGIAVAHQLLSLIATYLAEDVGWTATNQMRSDLAAHVVDLDMGFHKEHTPGELIERIDGDVTSLSNFFSAFVIRVLANSLLVVGILVLLWLENPWVGFGLTVFAAISLYAMLKTQAIAVPWWKQVRARAAELFGFIGEQVRGTEDIRANGGVPYMLHRFTGILRAWLPEQIRGRFGFSVLWGTSIAQYIAGTALVFWLGSVFFGRGALTIGSVYLVFHYAEMMRHPMEQIRAQMEDFQKAGAGIARVEELFERRSALPESGTARLPSGPLSVEFDGVTFAYRDRDPNGNGNGRPGERVLHGISFAVDAGRIVGVLGRSGSGKTTLARLLTRLYDPDGGAVRIGGVGAAEADVHDLRRHVGMVTQDVQLFQASIRDNLTFFDDTIDDTRLLVVLDELGLTPWLESLPDGLDTHLEASGAGLSAGQAQLLAFTRIFLEDPGLVILDEASSRLDPATESLIERAVGRLLQQRTGFIIAHRLATVTRADDILILEDGELVEFGERTALVADSSSRFSRLLTTGMEEVLA
jgi:ABC-type multidrug transport system fused ATPase/permease subunit